MNFKTISEIHEVNKAGPSFGIYEYSDSTDESFIFQESVYNDYYVNVNKWKSTIKDDKNVCKVTLVFYFFRHFSTKIQTSAWTYQVAFLIVATLTTLRWPQSLIKSNSALKNEGMAS